MYVSDHDCQRHSDAYVLKVFLKPNTCMVADAHVMLMRQGQLQAHCRLQIHETNLRMMCYNNGCFTAMRQQLEAWMLVKGPPPHITIC